MLLLTVLTRYSPKRPSHQFKMIFLFLVDANEELKTHYRDESRVKFMIYDLTNADVNPQIYQEVSSKTPTLDLVIHFAGILELGI